MTLESDVLNRLTMVMGRLEQRISDLEKTIHDIRTGQPSSLSENLTLAEKFQIGQIQTKSYAGHRWTVARDPLVKTPSVYNVPHYADAFAVVGTTDYQVEVDEEVSDATPINNAFSPFSAELRVNTKITYQIPKAFIEQFGDVQGVLYVYLFWY